MRTGNSPSYLIKTPYSFCFRLTVPKDLQKILARKELRYSLGTGNLSAAKIKARYMAGQVQQFFRDIKESDFVMNVYGPIEADCVSPQKQKPKPRGMGFR